MSLLNKFQQKVCLVIILVSVNLLIRGGFKTPKVTKIEIFVSTINDSQSSTVVTKNFVLDATNVLDLRDKL